jgi:hypothetical protein
VQEQATPAALRHSCLCQQNAPELHQGQPVQLLLWRVLGRCAGVMLADSWWVLHRPALSVACPDRCPSPEVGCLSGCCCCCAAP